MIEYLQNLLEAMRPAFSRRAAFVWFVVAFAGFVARSDTFGVRSCARYGWRRCAIRTCCISFIPRRGAARTCYGYGGVGWRGKSASIGSTDASS